MAFFLEKQQTGATPQVLIDEAKGYMKIKGESFHEDITTFYQDISEWLDRYLSSNFESLTFDCELQYFNSSTSKVLYNMLANMNRHVCEGKKIVVNWISDADNEIIIECGEDFQSDLEDLTFNMVMK